MKNFFFIISKTHNTLSLRRKKKMKNVDNRNKCGAVGVETLLRQVFGVVRILLAPLIDHNTHYMVFNYAAINPSSFMREVVAFESIFNHADEVDLLPTHTRSKLTFNSFEDN
jgi:hypothetical protein